MFNLYDAESTNFWYNLFVSGGDCVETSNILEQVVKLKYELNIIDQTINHENTYNNNYHINEYDVQGNSSGEVFSMDDFYIICNTLIIIFGNISATSENSNHLIELLEHSTNVYELYTKIQNYNYNAPFKEKLIEIFNPIIKHLQKNSYEITVTRIQVYESSILQNDMANHLNDITIMEEAYSDKDFGLVTTKSTAIIESILKEVLTYHRIDFNNKDNIVSLYNKVAERLNLSPGAYKEDPELRKFTSSIYIIMQKIHEIRNIYSASHGSTDNIKTNFNKLHDHHYKLIVDTTKTLINFWLGSLDFQYQNSSV